MPRVYRFQAQPIVDYGVVYANGQRSGTSSARSRYLPQSVIDTAISMIRSGMRNTWVRPVRVGNFQLLTEGRGVHVYGPIEPGLSGPRGLGAGEVGANFGEHEAAANLSDYLQANGCDCSAQLSNLTRALQTAYNNAVDGGLYPGSAKVAVDGAFGRGSAAAYKTITGVDAGYLCYVGGVASPCGPNQHPAPATPTTPDQPPTPATPDQPPAPTPLPPAPSPNPPPGTTHVNVVQQPASSSNTAIWVGAALLAGLGVAVYVKNKKKR